MAEDGKSEMVESTKSLPTLDDLEGGNLTPVRIEPDLEIRTITGLRPYRSSGFMVRKEERNGKSVIHNYGHGGGGITLSWGSSHLATQLAGSVAGKSCAVIGGGVMGLSTARLLQLHGAAVTLYTRDLPPETTSNIAGAQWWPVSVFSPDRRTEAFSRQFIDAANFSHRYFQNLVGPRWGVRWLPNYYLSDAEPENGWLSGPGGVLHHLQIDLQDFGPGEHIFPANYVRRFHTMLIEPATYLATLLSEVRGAGAQIVVREFASESEILSLPENLIFNCSGLGSGGLFDDPELMPIKGQLSVLMPQPDVGYNLISDLLYMFPRTDGVILGGTFDRGRSDLAVDPADRQRILTGHQRLFDQMAKNQQAVRNQSAGI
ncbi:FAD-dependent oxidoreductase [Luteolibacter pohnpeiensis]|uniref:D-amino-acid oxidase n=1 Tax=Luteolibacter pohnpeiensis TaxID=454153 RepID=A0A934VWQ3_9BACT|nr:FAD-dependent oxidoreductase [Luteolibacter pohnpeiensis]MBK1883520.1 FAD-dependent oxidoreductase [Luteolibacter pohnpeiensis]